MTTTTDSETVATRDRLIEGAASLLHSQAYRAVGVKALCEAAGVRKGSFYHFFASKEELTLAALDRSWERFRTGVIEPAVHSAASPEERNQAIREACLDLSRPQSDWQHPHGCIFGRLAASIADSEPLLRRRLAEIFTEWAALLGGGATGWGALADIMGRLVLAFSVEIPEVVKA
jgi:TetR/AcrR family transcriptional repressor of nem operon